MYGMYISTCTCHVAGAGLDAPLPHQRAASLLGAQLQALHVLRPLRLTALRLHQAGPTMCR